MPKSKVSKRQQKASATERLRKARAAKQPSVSSSSNSVSFLKQYAYIFPSIHLCLLLPVLS